MVCSAASSKSLDKGGVMTSTQHDDASTAVLPHAVPGRGATTAIYRPAFLVFFGPLNPGPYSVVYS